MSFIEWTFWVSIALLGYTYVGYGLVAKLLSLLKPDIDLEELDDEDLPQVTHVIAAYNEEGIIREKIKNCLQQNYPGKKIETIFVTDGSTDSTPDIARENEEVHVFHAAKRSGKLAAVNRVLQYIESPIVVFSDANAMLSPNAIRKMVKHFQNNRVGAVAGEKVVLSEKSDDAASAGEGIYWKYESWMKKIDYRLGSVMGAAGELFAVRTHLYEPPKQKALIEDFVISMNMVKKGYRVAYEPEAKAMEYASLSIDEEAKRKVRISAGGLQAIYLLYPLLNVLKYGMNSFMYLSHRVLRWTLAPVALVPAFWANMILFKDGSWVYDSLMYAQFIFYGMAIIGYYMESIKIKAKVFFIPFYFTFMNACVYMGAAGLLKGNLSVSWEKAARKI